MSESSRGGATGRGGRGKGPAPRGRGRRTQAERDQISQAEKERNKERDTQYAQEQNKARIAREREERDRKRREENAARGRGRGGFMGGSGGPLSGGPLSGGSAIGSSVGRGQAFPRPWAPSNRPGASRTTSGVKVESGSGGGGGGGGGGGSSSRAQTMQFQMAEGFRGDDAIDGGYISSDPDEPETGPRRPIESINLISDDEDEDGPRERHGAPTRLVRTEHRARAIQVNAEAGGDPAVKQEDEDVTMDDAPAISRAKSKSRDKSLEITGQRPFQGAWRDPVQEIKEEPPELPSARARGSTKDAPEDPNEPRSRPVREVRPRVFTNVEEEKEYLREEEDNKVMREEFGDVNAHKDELRTYLFQFPPILPNLTPPKPITIKDDPDGPPPAATASSSTNPAATADKPIKIEDPDSFDPLKPAKSLATDTSIRPAHLPTLAPGSVGKLNVHKSGKVTMDWGGSSFIVRNGVAPKFLQTLVMVQPAQGEGGNAQNMGVATAFGQPRGKLVVVPDWEEMLDGKVKGMKVE